MWTWLTNLVTDSRIDLTLDSPSLPKYTTVRWILLSWWIHTSLTELKNKVHSRKYIRHYSFRKQSHEALTKRMWHYSFRMKLHEALSKYKSGNIVELLKKSQQTHTNGTHEHNPWRLMEVTILQNCFEPFALVLPSEADTRYLRKEV